MITLLVIPRTVRTLYDLKLLRGHNVRTTATPPNPLLPLNTLRAAPGLPLSCCRRGPWDIVHSSTDKITFLAIQRVRA
ncbi:MAG: hypothetical protein MK364_10800 [Pirellulales bacterium]|nr:hypothetical protein [Pirellulales bacterium]